LLATHANCLAVGTRVAEFEIVGLIGEGGFGIVYLARDTSLDRVVALKEFMPAAFAGRIDGVRVAVRAANHTATFDAGLKSFINEAKMLAKFAHPALVEVFRFWEGNGTAYMAMRLYRGQTLRQEINKGTTRFTEESIAQIMGPIFDALEMLHREQVFHRDIAPDNIMLAEGRSVLLDFGSARKIIGDATQALTTVLKPGYAPIEQYSDDGTMKQGAWTDVYALGGVLYHMAAGKAPLQAVSRMLTDPLQSINEVTSNAFPPLFSDAVRKAMSVRVEDRFQTVTEFRQALGWNVGLQPRVVTLPNAPQVWLEPAANGGTKTGGAATGSGQPSSSGLGDVRVRGESAPAARAPEAAAPRSKMSMIVALASVALIGAAIAMWYGKRVPSDVPPPAATKEANKPAAPQPVPVADPAPKKEEAVPAASNEPAAEGVVMFDIKPWGIVTVDGVAKGVSTRIKQLTLPVGSHTVEISNPPAAPLKRTIDVVKDAPVTITHTFR